MVRKLEGDADDNNEVVFGKNDNLTWKEFASASGAQRNLSTPTGHDQIQDHHLLGI